MNTVAVVLAGIILAGGAVKALPSVWAFVKAIAKAPIILERIHAEFAPNGGSSLRDALNRIERHHGERLAAIEHRLDISEAADAAVARALAKRHEAEPDVVHAG